MIYEVWNARTRNLVASFETEEAALAFDRDALDRHGADYAGRLALASEDDYGRSTTVAIGASLVERARSDEDRVGRVASPAMRPA